VLFEAAAVDVVANNVACIITGVAVIAVVRNLVSVRELAVCHASFCFDMASVVYVVYAPVVVAMFIIVVVLVDCSTLVCCTCSAPFNIPSATLTLDNFRLRAVTPI